MADTTYQLQAAGTGPLCDTQSVVVGANTVLRQTMTIGDPSTGANVAKVDSSGNLFANISNTVTNSPVAVGGGFIALPTPTANGAVLTSGTVGTEITIPPGCSVTYTISTSAPVSPPGLVRTTANSASATAAITDQINLSSTAEVYLTASASNANTGASPFYRAV